MEPSKTAEPRGTRSADILARRKSAVARGVYEMFPLTADHASGGSLWDHDGREMIDFAGGIGSMNVGHAHPKVVAAIARQAAKLTHACFHLASYEPYIELAEKLNAIVPGDFPKKTVLVNSGAEAVENAIKIARAATGRQAVLCFEHAFHGRTLMGMSLTAKVHPYKQGFGPFAPEIYRIPFPYCFRCPEKKSEQCCMASGDYLDRRLAGVVGPENLAAVLIEPVTGEGGFIPAPPEFLRTLVGWCRDNGIVLIADEIQTGFGRTGKMFAMEHAGVAADITTMAKSLAGGLPLSAITGRAEIMDKPAPGGLGGTFGGNPVSCAAALAVLEVFEEERLVERAVKIGATVWERFRGWQARYSFIGDVRGLGAMQAIELVDASGSGRPDAARTARIQDQAFRRGLILLNAGTYSNVIRTLMPLGISDEKLSEGLRIMEAALEASS